MTEDISSRKYGPDEECLDTFLTEKPEVDESQILFQKELKVVQINLVKFDKLMMQVDDNLPRTDT